MDSSPAAPITDHVASELSWRLVMVTSLLVGFNTHGIIYYLATDLKALRRKSKWPEMVIFYTARILGMTFIVTSMVILETPATIHNNCNRNTRLAICAFFLSHGMHHLQFTLRLLSLYRHRWDLLVLQLTGCFVILGLCLFAAIESQSGIVLPSNGCVLVFNSSTLPDRTSLLILASLSVFQQAFTSSFAIVKLCKKYDADNRDGLPQSIYTALMIDGIPYWILRLVSVTVLFLLPLAFLIDHTLLVMTAFAIHTAVDVELSALILRNSPPMNKADRRSSFGILGEASVYIDEEEKKPKEMMSVTSRPSSMHLFAKDKKEQCAVSVDRLPLYNQSLTSKDWNRSQATLVPNIHRGEEGKEEESLRSKTFDSAMTIHTTPPTRPPRTKSTRLTHSLTRMLTSSSLSSTSRYASVIHFYQNTPVPSPQADRRQNEWTVERIATPTPRPPRTSSRSVNVTPPPKWI